MTVESLQRLPCFLVIIIAIFFGEVARASSPAYTDDQLDIVNKALEDWRSESKYPAVKDIFKGRSYTPDWNSLTEDTAVWDVVPDSFKNEREALRAGGKCDFIKDSRRKTVFLENGCLGESRLYRMNYNIVNGNKPRIEARYSYDVVCVTTNPYDFHSAWKDWLFWNEKAFSFYDARNESEKRKLASNLDSKFSWRLRVERNRNRIINLPPLPQGKSAADDDSKYWKGIGL